MNEPEKTTATSELHYKIPIFAQERAVFRMGKFKDQLLICRREETIAQAKTSFLCLGSRKPVELHFVDQSLPSGGFRHDAIRLDFLGDTITMTPIEAPPPPANSETRRVMIGRVNTSTGIQFKFTKQS